MREFQTFEYRRNLGGQYYRTYSTQPMDEHIGQMIAAGWSLIATTQADRGHIWGNSHITRTYEREKPPGLPVPLTPTGIPDWVTVGAVLILLLLYMTYGR